MSNAMCIAMTGINAGQEAITVVSDNIANINTTAFKESAISFQDIWYKTYTTGTTPTSTSGGTNPKQVGVGVMNSSITKNFDASTINTTGKTSDMAIQGDGFFTILSPNGAIYYTRDGNFTLDSDGHLVTAAGNNVMGTNKSLSYESSEIKAKIPQSLETVVSPQPTDKFGIKKLTETNAADIIEGNFKVNVIKADDSIASATINIGNPAETTMTALANQITTQLAAQNIDATCVAENGTLRFIVAKDPDAGTDLLKSMSFESGTSNFVQTTDIAWSSKVPSTATTNAYYETAVLDYTSTVKPVSSVDKATTLESWSVSSSGVIEAKYSNGDAITVYLDENDKAYKFKYTTSTGVEIMDKDVYSDPNVLVVGNLQLQFANVTNNQGLTAIGSNLYNTGPNCGRISYTTAGANGVGELTTGGLENSNVDMSRQFSNMLLAQRGIEANSRVFDTANSILQTLVYLGRG